MPSFASSDAVVAVEGFGWSHAGAPAPALREVDLRLEAGECVWLTGASGSGKSTLLRGIAGVLPRSGRAAGRIRVRGRPALLFQNVETQLLCTTVAEEIDFGPSQRGAAAAQRDAQVRRALEQVGLGGFERRSVDALSAGEKQRVVLAALLALEPSVLLLDEPTSALDPAGRARLARLLRGLTQRGHAVLVADHLGGPFVELARRRFTLDAGRLEVATGTPDAPLPPSRGRAGTVAGEPNVLSVFDLWVRDADGRAPLRGVSLRVARGERVLLAGANGAGKTTLLRAIAGLARPARGRIRSEGADATPRAGAVGLLFQNPQRNLFERTVAEEIAFALGRAGAPRRAIVSRVSELLERCDLVPLRDRSPLRLSFGEQQRVAVAAVLAPRPRLLLLDEPFAGLDLAARARLLDVLAQEQARYRTAVLIASHDPEPLSAWVHRRVELEGGALRHG